MVGERGFDILTKGLLTEKEKKKIKKEREFVESLGGGPSAPAPMSIDPVKAAKPPKAPDVLPTEKAKRVQKAKEYIQAREKLASKLEAGGMSNKKALMEAQRQLIGFGEGEQVSVEEVREKTLEEIPEARDLAGTTEGAFAKTYPSGLRGDLVAGEAAGGPLSTALNANDALKKLKKDKVFRNKIKGMTEDMIKAGKTPKQMTSDPLEQMFLSLELNEKDLKLIESGKSDVNALEIQIEALPLGKYVGFVGAATIGVTVPSDKINDLSGQVEQIGNSVRDWRMAAARSPQNSDKYVSLLEDAEDNMRDAESRIKLLIIQSPELQNAPEEVEKLQAKLNRHLNRVGDARNAILGGETIEELMNIQAIEQAMEDNQ